MCIRLCLRILLSPISKSEGRSGGPAQFLKNSYSSSFLSLRSRAISLFGNQSVYDSIPSLIGLIRSRRANFSLRRSSRSLEPWECLIRPHQVLKNEISSWVSKDRQKCRLLTPNEKVAKCLGVGVPNRRPRDQEITQVYTRQWPTM